MVQIEAAQGTRLRRGGSHVAGRGAAENEELSHIRGPHYLESQNPGMIIIG
jgi:hypothetical protein